MTLEELDREINNKISQNDEFVRYTYFELKVKNIYDIKNVTITSKRMFVKNGVPYVYSKVNISFYNDNDKSTLYQTSAEVISKLIG